MKNLLVVGFWITASIFVHAGSGVPILMDATTGQPRITQTGDTIAPACLGIGSNVQAWNANLDLWAAIAPSAYAVLASPALTGTPTAPTASGGTNTTQLATTAFVTSAVSAVSTAYAPIASPTFTGIVTVPKISTNGSLPTIATGTGAGTGSPTATMTTGSTDTAGSFTIVSGTTLTPAANATIATLTFNVSPGAAPKAVIITPGNLATSSLFGPSAPFISATSSTTFTVTSGSAAIGGATTFKYYYLVIW